MYATRMNSSKYTHGGYFVPNLYMPYDVRYLVYRHVCVLLGAHPLRPRFGPCDTNEISSTAVAGGSRGAPAARVRY